MIFPNFQTTDHQHSQLSSFHTINYLRRVKIHEWPLSDLLLTKNHSLPQFVKMIFVINLLPLLAILAPAIAQVACETSDASPTTEDVTAAIN